MCTLVANNTVRAEISYDCNSSEWLREYLKETGTKDLSISEMRLIVKARQDKYKIKSGDLYNYSLVMDEDNALHPFRSIIGIGELCFKHKMFP